MSYIYFPLASRWRLYTKGRYIRESSGFRNHITKELLELLYPDIIIYLRYIQNQAVFLFFKLILFVLSCKNLQNRDLINSLLAPGVPKYYLAPFIVIFTIENFFITPVLVLFHLQSNNLRHPVEGLRLISTRIKLIHTGVIEDSKLNKSRF